MFNMLPLDVYYVTLRCSLCYNTDYMFKPRKLFTHKLTLMTTLKLRPIFASVWGLGISLALSLTSCEQSTVAPVESSAPATAEVDLDAALTFPLFAEYWGLLPEYQTADFGLVRAEDVPEGTNVVHLFVFDKNKNAQTGEWTITNRFGSSYDQPVQEEAIPDDILAGIRDIQSRGIAVVFSIFTPSIANEADADAFASACFDFTETWGLDGVEIDLEGVATSSYLLPALGNYFGRTSESGKILAVVDYNNLNITHIRNANTHLTYVNTMSYWNTSQTVSSVLNSYANAIGDPTRVLIGVGGGPGINAGQATPRGEEVAIAEWLRTNSPGSGMMNFIMDADYSLLDENGNVSRSMAYSEGIIAALKQ